LAMTGFLDLKATNDLLQHTGSNGPFSMVLSGALTMDRRCTPIKPLDLC